MLTKRRLWLLLILFVAQQGAIAEPNNTAKALAPGYSELKYAAPIPGTYQLPMLGMAGDGEVLDSEGRSKTLHKLMGHGEAANKIILLSFIYSTCSDVNGCPLATVVFHKIKNRLKKQPELAKRLRLLTLSFNPEHDTPERMKAYGAELQGNELEWLFLTTRSERELQPLLKAYPQKREKVYDANGKFTNTFNHNLRVYLIDEQKRVRNIYNTELLHPDLLISDIKTLLKNEIKPITEAVIQTDKQAALRIGDNKTLYESQAYQTHSIALAERKGQPADLFKHIAKPPLGLPKVPIPYDNPITQEKISLGRKLFYDRRLSLNDTFSCAMCHIPEQGFTSNEMAMAVGIEGRSVKRNSPTLYNVAYLHNLFHDGRESTLENQVWGPLLADNEMANPSIGYVLDKLKLNSDYNGLFEKAFGKPPTMEIIGMALASYERTLNSANSPFDRWFFGKEENAISQNAKQGFKLFTGKANCSQCHTINSDSALFTDNGFHNTGIGYADAMHDQSTNIRQRVQVSPGVYVDVKSEIIRSVAESKANDLGRYEVTQKPKDRWLYKTPSLRNISLTAPYMHNGSLATLKQVIEFYSQGGISNENLDNLIKPLPLSGAEIEQLTEFLETLTGDNVEELVSDAFAAPVGERQ